MKKTVAIGALWLLPAVAFAQNLDNVRRLIVSAGNIINILVPIAFTLAVLAFFWGLAKYIFNANDEDKKAEGKNIMIWGIVALFVMSAVWGIVRFIGDAVGINTSGNQSQNVPSVNNGLGN